jgi:4a-hydroxytetrahydrobiopterin dehydratase
MAKKSGTTQMAAPANGKLSDAQIKDAMVSRPEWAETGGAIQRTFQFKNFVEAMRFVNRAAEAAEAMNHHPDILVRYNKVTMTLSTHDAGGITSKDFELAGRMDAMV